jgi:hypothetical protein
MGLTDAEKLELAQLQGQVGSQEKSGLTESEKIELAQLQGATGETTEKPASADVPLSRKLQAAAQGAGKNVMFGYSPQVNGAIAKGADIARRGNDWVADKLGMDKLMSTQGEMEKQGFKFPEENVYTDARDANIRYDKQLQKDAPLSYGAGSLAGMIASSVLLPGGQAAEGASLAQKIRNGMKAGALYSGLANPGDTEGEVNPLQMGERLDNAKTGMIIGGAIPAASPMLKNAADRLGFRSLGSFVRDTRLLNDKGQTNEIGRAALDNGTIGWIPRGFGALKKRAAAIAESAGEKVRSHIGSVDNAIEGSGGTIKGVDRHAIADQLETQLIQPDEMVQGVAGAEEKNNTFKKLIKNFRDGKTKVAEELENAPEGLIPEAPPAPEIPQHEGVQRTWDKKQIADDNSGWQKLKTQELTPHEEFNRALGKAQKDQLENAATRVEEETGNKMGSYKAKAKDYSQAATIKKILSLRDSHEIARRAVAPLIGASTAPLISAASGRRSPEQLAEAAIIGAMVGQGGRMVNRYGPQIGAKTLDALSKMPQANPWLNSANIVRSFQGEKDGKE